MCKINNKHLLCSIGTNIQYLIITYDGKESEKVCVCVCVCMDLNHFAVTWNYYNNVNQLYFNTKKEKA